MIRLLAAALLCAIPARSLGQVARPAASVARDVELLHEAAIQATNDPTAGDPQSIRQLATMYSTGDGLAPDAIVACTLAQFADMTTRMRPGPAGEGYQAYEARMSASEAFVQLHCDRLTAEDRLTAGRSLGCFAFGMPEETVPVGNRGVRIGRRGVGFADGSETPRELINCPAAFGGVRTFVLQPPSDAAPGVAARHFLALFTWAAGTDRSGSHVYSLRWQMYEVRGSRLLFFMPAEDLAARSSWPPRELPVEIDKGLTLEMIRSGHVRWKLEGTPPRRGWLMLDGYVK